MQFNLAELAKAQGRRKDATLRAIIPPRMFARELAAITRQVYQPYVDALPRLIAQYEASLADITTDTAADLDATLDDARRQADGLLLILTPRLRFWAERVQTWHLERWIAAVISPTRVDLSTILSAGDVRETLETAIRRNTSLITNISDSMRQRIGDAVFRGLQNRTPAREVAAELRRAVGIERRRSVNVAADQLQKLTSSLDRERLAQAGVRTFAWQHSGKVHYRDTHRARDGKKFEIGTPAGDEPGQLPYCGCKRRAVLEIE